jgi:hypothetical protein
MTTTASVMTNTGNSGNTGNVANNGHISDTYHQIDKIVRANKIYRFEAELNDANNTISDERRKMLETLILQELSYKDSKQLQGEMLQGHLKVLKDSQYQKKWQFLNQDQRINRLDEFIVRNKFTNQIIDQVSGKPVATRLKKYLNEQLFKPKHIVYNGVKSIIEEITILTLDDDKKYHIVDLIGDTNVVVDNKKIDNKDNKDNDDTDKKTNKQADKKDVKKIDKTDKKDEPIKAGDVKKIVRRIKKD